MEITWLGHSCIRVSSSDGVLLAEPYADSIGYSLGRPTASIVTVSHDHPHHSHADGVAGDPRVLQGPGEYEIASFYITGMGTDRNLPEGEPAINTVFSIHAEGLVLCHLGDLNRALSPRQIDELGSTDILFVPAGGLCTIGTSSAAELVRLVAPKIVVPLHYGLKTVSGELLPLDAFLDDMGVTDPDHRASLSVSESTLPQNPQIVVLNRAR